MSTPPQSMASIRDRLSRSDDASGRFLWGADATICVAQLHDGTSLGGRLPQLAGRSVLVASRDQFAAALALVELDGVASRLIVGTPDLAAEHLATVVATGEVDAIVTDGEAPSNIPLRVRASTVVVPSPPPPSGCETEWVLLTSGTTGAPKMVVHSFATLAAPIAPDPAPDVVWGTFYDIRRYGGLQIFLRALLGRGSFVMSDAREPIGEHLVRLGSRGVTHVSGTPSHWRRALMSPAARSISPRYIRLSGEIADQGILDALRWFYPDAAVGHAFASTEAGVAFEVGDGLEGFPASFLGARRGVQIEVVDGSLRIRSPRTASRQLGDGRSSLAGDDGFVDTGDVVERRGDRYYFLGRQNGVINVGGLKVFPEEVEAAINRHPAVRMSMVRPKKNAFTGSLVAAEVVLKEPSGGDAGVDFKREILQLCHDRLAPHKVPATIQFVPALDLAAAGKLARHA